MRAWTEADFAQFYSVPDYRSPNPTGQRYSYGLNFARYVEQPDFQYYRRRVTELLNRNLYSAGQTAFVVGCGFGYLLAVMLEAGAQDSRVWGTDISQYIHDNKATESPPEYPVIPSHILNIDIRDPDALNQLKPYTGGNGKVDWVICEEVTEGVALTDRPAWYASCEALLSPSGNVAHIVHTDPMVDGLAETYGITIQSLADWAAAAPTHYWFDERLNMAGGA